MNKIQLGIDLSLVPEDDRPRKLVELLMNKNLVIEVSVAPDEHLTFSGYGVYGATLVYDTHAFPPIKVWADNKKEDVLVFLENILPVTGQWEFPVRCGASTLPANLIREITLDKIDWEATVDAVKSKLRLEESCNSDYDKVTIHGIENSKYRVRVDSLAWNPRDREISKCRKHLLRVYHSMFKKKQRPTRRAHFNKKYVY